MARETFLKLRMQSLVKFTAFYTLSLCCPVQIYRTCGGAEFCLHFLHTFLVGKFTPNYTASHRHTTVILSGLHQSQVYKNMTKESKSVGTLAQFCLSRLSPSEIWHSSAYRD
jgi:hypothetical protein